MENSALKPRHALAALALVSCLALSAEEGEPLAIILDAESSSFDQKTNTVIFRGLQITQGEFGISADEAVASAVDFERSEWRFSGNVRVTVESAVIEADSAKLVFEAHTLLVAELRGEPARFEDLSTTREEPIRGSANLLSYDNTNRILSMTDGARLSEGSNEFTGCNFIYDLEQEQITSGSSECGTPIVITIVPPSNDVEPESAPPP